MIKLAVFDLDNTLYDWVSYFARAFGAMVDVLVREHGASESVLLERLQRVHRAQGTTEYAFALEGIDVLHGIEDAATDGEANHPAVAAFWRESVKHLRAYEDVPAVLESLRREGRTLVAYTDAMATYADARLEQLDLARYFSELVATRDHAVPEAASEFLSWLPPSRFRRRAVVRHSSLGPDERKPCPAPLLRLLAARSVAPHEAVFVGDSLTRDIPLAQQAGVHDVFAAYGRGYDPALWAQLVAVTHWTDADVARERQRDGDRVEPTYVLRRFAELPGIIAGLDDSDPHD